MPDNISVGTTHNGYSSPRERVAIETNKIYDCCRDKECLQDIRVYLTQCSQAVIDSAINVKPTSAELLWAYTDVEPVPFNKGHYTVDVKFFYKINADAFSGLGHPTPVTGLATYDKRTVLFGSEGEVKIFSSQFNSGPRPSGIFEKTNLPIAVVEAVDPVILGIKMISSDQCPMPAAEIPENISSYFNDDFVLDPCGKALYATLGQFSIIRLERETQMVVPSYGYYMPDKECSGFSDEPCDLFQQFNFPVNEFFPPKVTEFTQRGGVMNPKCSCNKGCQK